MPVSQPCEGRYNEKGRMGPSDNGKLNSRILGRNHWILMLTLVIAILGLSIIYHEQLAHHLKALYQLVLDRDRFSALISSSGIFAPLVFITLQVLQVIFAPVPGEATGFIGGYIFGAGKGFLFSTIGLSIGSLLNLLIGRYLGKRFIRRHIPTRYLERFDTFLRHQGIIVIFILFVVPGFPKDYLCLFLGLSNLPIKVLLLLATIGRLPGTLMLSLQGAFLFERNYILLGAMAAASLIIVLLAYRYRDNLYRWIEKLNQNDIA
jgi:uncharacterized membrane protein YdjX (TVP38/TMEM64 family)